MRRAKVAVLASLILLTDFYVVHPSIRLPTLVMTILVASFVIKRGVPKVALFRGSPVAKILGAALVFSGFMAVVDFGRGASLYEVSVQLFSQGLVAMMLPAFLDEGRPFALASWFRSLSLVSLGFACLQVIGLPIILASIFPGLGVIGADRIVESFVDSYGRASGATSNTIAFAMQMVLLALFAYAAFELGNRGRQLRYGVLGLIGLVLSQTRAALFGLIPAIMLSRLLLGGARLRELMKVAPVLALGIFGAWILQVVASDLLPYVAKEIDTGDTHRFWTNWYMVVGVFRESPLLGVSPGQAWDVYFRYGDMTVTQFSPDMATPTHHNQLGYYFRYYGFVGIGLLGFLYWRVWQGIKGCDSIAVRVLLGAVFILDFIYSMAHNNKLITSPLLWIVLSMAFLPADRAERMLAGAKAK